MISLPIRVELQIGIHSDSSTCSLTIPSIDFLFAPTSGDFVLLTKDSDEPFAIPVNRVVHYDNGTALVLLRPVICDDYDEMLENLDWIKNRYEIQDLKADESPEPYYILYRTVIHLLQLKGDIPIVLYDPDIAKILAETCRTVWLAAQSNDLPTRDWICDNISKTNDGIKLFHQLVFGYKMQFPNGVELRRVIKDWDSKINEDRSINWDVDDDLCSFIGDVVFSKLKCDKPGFLIQ